MGRRGQVIWRSARSRRRSSVCRHSGFRDRCAALTRTRRRRFDMRHVSWIIALVIGFSVGFFSAAPSTAAARRARRQARRSSGRHGQSRIERGLPRARGRHAAPRPRGRARHDRRVVRLRVPVLQARRSDAEAARGGVPGQAPLLLPPEPAAVPRAGAAGRDRRRGGARAGGDAKFWAMHDKLFELAPALDDASIERAAQELGLDVAKVKEAIASGKHRRISATSRSSRPWARPRRRRSSSTAASSPAPSRSRSSARSSRRS